jgi:hypothetical protein
MLLGDKTVYVSSNHNLNITFVVVSLNNQFILFSFLSAYKPSSQVLVLVHTSEILFVPVDTLVLFIQH